ncbi:uncharacterized protein MKZ38_004015 [Zalerion maritima]|uniref:ADF-H domain-containing protein n=1 Tax=Zalerion maritima TaxID=339359 RepID=A0AAD5RMN4_9PEZI|nr:uncharacterized protein MKZ38_004015 [Zalerion maritima]
MMRNDMLDDQSSEARLYTFTPETKKKLLDFRLKSSRVNAPQAQIYFIDKKNYEIKQQEPAQTYTSLDDLEEDLPENTPRFVLLSHPVKVSLNRAAFAPSPAGRTSANRDQTWWSGTKQDDLTKYPYVMLYYLPITCNSELRMTYAGAKELMRNTSEVQRIVDMESSEELSDLPKKHLGDTS